MQKLFSVLVLMLTVVLSSFAYADEAKGTNLAAPQKAENQLRTFQLRTYTLRSKEAAQTYLNVYWKRHLVSLPKYGVKVHGVFLVQKDNVNQVIALVSFEPGANVAEVNGKYMHSPDFKADMQGFSFRDMVSVDETLLQEADYSPTR